jgi:hypothetical protein
MPSVPISESAIGVDLTPRFIQSVTVAASPSAASETTVCTLTIPPNVPVVNGIIVMGFAAFTVGTSGANCNLKIRQTGTSGATIAATGATTGGISAGNLVDMNVMGMDTAPIAGGVYVLTLTIGSGAATSTVSATQLVAIIT